MTNQSDSRLERARSGHSLVYKKMAYKLIVYKSWKRKGALSGMWGRVIRSCCLLPFPWYMCVWCFCTHCLCPHSSFAPPSFPFPSSWDSSAAMRAWFRLAMRSRVRSCSHCVIFCQLVIRLSCVRCDSIRKVGGHRHNPTERFFPWSAPCRPVLVDDDGSQAVQPHLLPQLERRDGTVAALLGRGQGQHHSLPLHALSAS